MDEETQLSQILLAVALWTLPVLLAESHGYIAASRSNEILALLRQIQVPIIGGHAPLYMNPCGIVKRWTAFSNIDDEQAKELYSLLSRKEEFVPISLADDGKRQEGPEKLDSITREEMIRKARLRFGDVSDEAAWALIAMARSYANDGDFDRAIDCQDSAVSIAEELYGRGSFQWSMAVVNLGSLHYQAKRYSEAVDRYVLGIGSLISSDHPPDIDAVRGSLENLMAAGRESGRSAEVGSLLNSLLEPITDPAVRISIGVRAAVSFGVAEQWAEADTRLRAVIDDLSLIEFEQDAWYEPVCTVAIGVASSAIDGDPRSAAMILETAARLTDRVEVVRVLSSELVGALNKMRVAAGLDGIQKEDSDGSGSTS
jgi:tetratricopeptide (TPR) repeat protein